MLFFPCTPNFTISHFHIFIITSGHNLFLHSRIEPLHPTPYVGFGSVFFVHPHLNNYTPLFGRIDCVPFPGIITSYTPIILNPTFHAFVFELVCYYCFATLVSLYIHFPLIAYRTTFLLSYTHFLFYFSFWSYFRFGFSIFIFISI